MQCSEDGNVVWKKQDNVLNPDGDEDIWDDSALIKAYDKAIASLKNTDFQDGMSLSSDNVIKKSTNRTKKKKSKKKSKENNNKFDENKWEVGDRCLALYSLDQLYYEATILRIHQNIAVVKYEFYDNEEEVDIDELLSVDCKDEMKFIELENEIESDLQESCGSSRKNEHHKKKEDLQFSGGWRISDICYVQDDQGAMQQVVINSFISSSRCMVTFIKTGKRKEVKVSHLQKFIKNHKKPHQSRPTHHPPAWFPANMAAEMLPPPPPPPHFMHGYPDWNMFGSSQRVPPFHPPFPPPPLPTDLPDDVMNGGDEEALANMLMSWYMNGYHTGYYQGLIQGKKSQSRDKNQYAESSVHETNGSL